MSAAIVIDPGLGGELIRTTKGLRYRINCLQCGTPFEVYPCHYKRGNAKFCSTGCGVTFRNLHNNAAKRPEVRAKISANHADVSGANNPMHGRSGADAPGYIDGRHLWADEPYRGMVLATRPHVCELCGYDDDVDRLHVHHKDKDRSNNSPENLTLACVWCHNNILHPRERDSLGRFV